VGISRPLSNPLALLDYVASHPNAIGVVGVTDFDRDDPPPPFQ
jgi:hypothetical protein